MTYLVASILVASLGVRHWPGQPPGRWVATWIDRVWLLIGVAFVAGLVFAFFNVTSSPSPGGGVRHIWSLPRRSGTPSPPSPCRLRC